MIQLVGFTYPRGDAGWEIRGVDGRVIGHVRRGQEGYVPARGNSAFRTIQEAAERELEIAIRQAKREVLLLETALTQLENGSTCVVPERSGA